MAKWRIRASAIISLDRTVEAESRVEETEKARAESKTMEGVLMSTYQLHTVEPMDEEGQDD